MLFYEIKWEFKDDSVFKSDRMRPSQTRNLLIGCRPRGQGVFDSAGFNKFRMA